MVEKDRESEGLKPEANPGDSATSEEIKVGAESLESKATAQFEPEHESSETSPSAVSPSELEELRKQLEEKERELGELKDKYLRVLADTENTRKRLRQQAEENVRLEREKLLRDLLPIVDDLERTVEAARGGGNGKPIVEGVELVLRSVKEFLRRYGVTQISAKGTRFDPAIHEALDRVESPDHEPNTVVDELHAGYMIGDRVLRPARVIVAKECESTTRMANGKDETAESDQAKPSGSEGEVEKS